MVVQVLANLLPAMIPDYAQAPAVYVETGWEYVLSVVDTFSCPSLSANIKASQP